MTKQELTEAKDRLLKRKELKRNLSESSIVIGCNYHVKWQSHKAMRFVLKEVKDNKARLVTRETKKDFWTNTSDLVFIMSKHNIDKALDLLSK